MTKTTDCAHRLHTTWILCADLGFQWNSQIAPHTDSLCCSCFQQSPQIAPHMNLLCSSGSQQNPQISWTTHVNFAPHVLGRISRSIPEGQGRGFTWSGATNISVSPQDACAICRLRRQSGIFRLRENNTQWFIIHIKTTYRILVWMCIESPCCKEILVPPPADHKSLF